MSYGRNEREWRENQERRNREDEQRRTASRDGGSRDGGNSDRGFFERAGDEISSWFSDDDHSNRGKDQYGASAGERGGRSEGRPETRHDEPRRDFSPSDGNRSGRDDGFRRPYSGRPPEQDGGRHDTGRQNSMGQNSMDRDQSYRPMTGDYGRASGPDRSSGDRFEQGPPRYATSGTSTGATAAHDRHYGEWRQRQIDQIDSDYDEYRREHQSKFESDFSAWRSTRQSKRELVGQIKEHMKVFGADEQPLGTVDKVRPDRLILTKSDSPDGKHHSVNTTMVARVDGDRVFLDQNAEEARALFGDEDRDRALNESDDQRQPGAHVLNRSFSGTY